jgi:hypothetical protein
MANKKAKSAGNQAQSNKPKPKQGKGQATKGLGSGSAQQSQPSSAKVDLSTKFTIRNTGDNGDITVTGSEIVGIAANTSLGNMVFIADFNPSTWASTRVARMIPLFETYMIVSLRIVYIPSCSTTTGGLLYMYYDRDPNDAPISSVSDPSNLARLMSNQNAVAGQVWKPISMTYKPAASDLKGYYAAPVNDAGDMRLTSQGMAYAYASAAQGAVAGGLFKFEYTIRLMTPTGPTSIKSSLTPWTLGSLPLATAASNSPVVPSFPAGSIFFNTTSQSEGVFEALFEYSWTGVIDGVTKTVAPYTPVFIRILGGQWRMWGALTSAVAATSDYFVGPGGGIAAGNAWVRLLLNLASAVSQEST